MNVATNFHNDNLEISDSSCDSSSVVSESGYSDMVHESTQKRIPGINKNVMSFPKDFAKFKLWAQPELQF